MMNCDKAKLLLSDYIDGALEPAVKKEIDNFLETNEECNTFFANAMSMQKQLKGLPKVSPSKEFEVNLRNRIISYNEGSEKQPAFYKKGVSLAFSGAILISALYLFIFTDVGSQQNAPEEILPSSTINNSQPSLNIQNDKLMVDQQESDNSVTESDSIKNIPEEVDNSKIHLTGDGR